MIELKQVTNDDYPVIQQIARETWPIVYGSILSTEQIDYMLDLMYSYQAIEQQINIKRHHFILVTEQSKPIGFFSYELNHKDASTIKIHKIYILPYAQGKGIGRFVISEIISIAKAKDHKVLSLNVNRHNKAFYFYEKVGFLKVREEDIDIGNNYVMQDYVMEKIV